MKLDQARFNMVEQQIRPWNVFADDVLRELGTLKREEFVIPEYQNLALADVEIPLPGNQKMLHPKIEARLLQELHLSKSDKVLEIGTGSGYVTAILAKLSDFVYSLESNRVNKEFAIANLTKAGIKNISVIEANGLLGLASKGPFDKIFIGGGLLSVPEAIKQQLKLGGCLVAVMGKAPVMHAVVIHRQTENQFSQTQLFETMLSELDYAHLPQFKF